MRDNDMEATPKRDANEHQHWVPRWILKRWAGRDGKLAYAGDDTEWKVVRRAVKYTFARRGLYNWAGRNRDLLERTLSVKEGDARRAIEFVEHEIEICREKGRAHQERNHMGRNREAVLKRFVLTQENRTPERLDHWAQDEALARIWREIEPQLAEGENDEARAYFDAVSEKIIRILLGEVTTGIGTQLPAAEWVLKWTDLRAVCLSPGRGQLVLGDRITIRCKKAGADRAGKLGADPNAELWLPISPSSAIGLVRADGRDGSSYHRMPEALRREWNTTVVEDAEGIVLPGNWKIDDSLRKAVEERQRPGNGIELQSSGRVHVGRRGGARKTRKSGSRNPAGG